MMSELGPTLNHMTTNLGIGYRKTVPGFDHAYDLLIRKLERIPNSVKTLQIPAERAPWDEKRKRRGPL